MREIRLGESQSVERLLPEEVAVAISVGGSTHGVMMASPHSLKEFAVGFLFSDGVIQSASDIENIKIVEVELGIDVQVWLKGELAEDYQQKRRLMAGPVGCGLCGTESLDAIFPNLKPVEASLMDESYPWLALKTLEASQNQRKIRGALHGAALLDKDASLLAISEDIGRHNALDKAIGALLLENKLDQATASVISSRVSMDLVLKSVRAGVGNLIARATPSNLAVTYAKKWGLCLAAPVFDKEYYLSGDYNE